MSVKVVAFSPMPMWMGDKEVLLSRKSDSLRIIYVDSPFDVVTSLYNAFGFNLSTKDLAERSYACKGNQNSIIRNHMLPLHSETYDLVHGAS